MIKSIFDAANPVKVTGPANKKKACELASKVNGKVIETDEAYLVKTRLCWVVKGLFSDAKLQALPWVWELRRANLATLYFFSTDNEDIWGTLRGTRELKTTEELLSDSTPITGVIYKRKRNNVVWADVHKRPCAFGMITPNEQVA